MELQHLEQQKIMLSNEIKNHQVTQSGINLTLGQMKEALEEYRELILTHHPDMMKMVISRFIHQIIITNETVSINYNYGGFFHDFKQTILLETKTYSKKTIYQSASLKGVS